ncbi:MAG: hypothetical protein IJT12_07040 [Paludibacteraceae bacterium]|nr:hypothetical protein [Paludibacteraceae bacterium]
MKKSILTLLCLASVLVLNAATEGALNGVFSVSPDKQVVFSRGNLQYQANSSSWRFAEHQYDYVGGLTGGNVSYASDRCNNTRIDRNYDGWIDLFGWGTGEQPWRSTENLADYGVFADWGRNTILNGGIQNDGWRTLDWEEWLYLFTRRPNAEQLRGQATVDKSHGYVLLPDNWELPKKLAFTPDANSWTTNAYSSKQWSQMEKAGAVFLPAGGFRSGQEVSVVGVMGFYWSSSLYNDLASGDGRDIFFGEKRFGPRDHEKRFYGLSVRLVLDLGQPVAQYTQPAQQVTYQQVQEVVYQQPAQPEPKPEVKPQAKPEPKPEPKSAQKPEPKPEPVVASSGRVNPVPEGALTGIYSVSPSKKVYFSRGNMLYNEDGYAGFAKFADHQWDFVGDDTQGTVYYNGVKSNNHKANRGYGGWIDLHEWGGNMGQNSARYRYSTFFGYKEWGHWSFENGGYPEQELWRTLTTEEWYYLFEQRKNAAKLRGQATVNNMHGYILLPDAWQLPQGLAFKPQPNNWSTNTYSAEQWALMEAAGAVFLPAAGVRNYKEIQGIGEMGAYWSSSMYQQTGEGDVDAKGIYFTADKANANMYDTWHHGFAVRVVQDIDFVKPKKKSVWDDITPEQLAKLPPLEPEQEWKLYADIHTIGDINPREGFRRIKVDPNSFGAYLRSFPLKDDWNIYYYNGDPVEDQLGAFCTLDIDIGNKDLLQCADAVMYLRASYLYAQKRYDEIHFNSLAGKRMNYTDYAKGDYSPAKFRKYLDYVFAYANTASLEKELPQRKIEDVQIGDIFVVSGNPGHAMMVVDMAVDKDGNRALLFAQGMMPAQTVHVVTNREHGEDTPWYMIDEYLKWSTLFVFPNYVFSAQSDLKYFPDK